MEERCNQALNCGDGSDEEGCATATVGGSYRRTVPPVALREEVLDTGLDFIPVLVRVGITLLDVAAIKEAENAIDLTFRTELKWKDQRVTFHNLKTNTRYNTLEEAERDLIWIPNIIYKNTKNSENTLAYRHSSTITVKREGNFSSRSSLEIGDEIEIFLGQENFIKLYQSDTKTFKCKYNMIMFPFDTQKCTIQMTVAPLDIFGVNLSLDKAKVDSEKELAQYFLVDNPTIQNKEFGTEIEMSIIFKRRLTNEAMTTFFPSMLLVTISYSTSFFKLPNFFNTAITVNVTVMLTITTLLISVVKKLAVTSYIKWIEGWLIFAQLVPFVQIIFITSIEWIREKEESHPDDIKIKTQKNIVKVRFELGKLQSH